MRPSFERLHSKCTHWAPPTLLATWSAVKQYLSVQILQSEDEIRHTDDFSTEQILTRGDAREREREVTAVILK